MPIKFGHMQHSLNPEKERPVALILWFRNNELVAKYQISTFYHEFEYSTRTSASPLWSCQNRWARNIHHHGQGTPEASREVTIRTTYKYGFFFQPRGLEQIPSLLTISSHLSMANNGHQNQQILKNPRRHAGQKHTGVPNYFPGLSD